MYMAAAAAAKLLTHAEKKFFLAHLAEITRLWKRGEYDSWKDAVQDAKSLVKDAKRFGKTHEASANKHLAAVVKRVTKEMEKDPGLKRYLKGLL
jgi:inorganic triphosphatase YgiF